MLTGCAGNLARLSLTGTAGALQASHNMNKHFDPGTEITRRTALKTGLMAAVGATVLPVADTRSLAADAPKKGRVSLREKVLRLHCRGSRQLSDGGARRRMELEQDQETYGTLERLLPYEHYRNKWQREPGTTEDGVERQKLMITAII
jgi:hypothetical protein